MKFKVSVNRVEYQHALVEIEADSAEEAREIIDEDGVDSDQFEVMNANEWVEYVVDARTRGVSIDLAQAEAEG